ncbi:probable ATP-dependent RNA helicase DDX31 [Carcharodon carcharias]|uniref:probable ATP-dependent RNA helicase DDX31 n=1 Tax=Carcharodon carcharias TaxID=13397 RepID=UPI001B7F59C8|nr:probable ATP-dependent RNA helicase DDX31 [Carcharodon carcharias]
MAADGDGLMLNITSNPQAPVFGKGKGKMYQRKALSDAESWQQAQPNGGSRRLQGSSRGDPPSLKQPNQKIPTTKRKYKNAQKLSSGERLPSLAPKRRKIKEDPVEKEEKEVAPVKTSSLFRHNPEIPKIPRQTIKTLKEKVFTTNSFNELNLHPHLVSTLHNVLKLSSMTSIQKQAIPILLDGKDALVQSQTGSGKTLAYGVPLVQSLQSVQPKIQRSDGPYAIVIIPTRELALQSFDTIQKLIKPFTWIVPGMLMGGEKRKSEKARLRKGINILISTPGRLVDHIKNTKNICFARVQWFVVDEADRLLDLGFEKDITVILNALNAAHEKRQNVLLSATLTDGVNRLAGISLKEPANIYVTETNESKPAFVTKGMKTKQEDIKEDSECYSIPEQLQQFMVMVPSKLRLVTLSAFILQKCKFEKKQKMIIFFSSCESVEFHYTLFTNVLTPFSGSMEFKQLPFSACKMLFLRLHGNMEQETRKQVFLEFSQSKMGVLLCTDVAARGLDLPEVTWIVQYNAPTSPAEYVHRVGRTARIGSCGNSLLFLTPSEAEYANVLVSHHISVSEMKMEGILSTLLMEHLPRKKSGLKSDGVILQEIRESATTLQKEYENYVHSTRETLLQAKKALQSFIRAYATYPTNLKHFFHVKALHLGHIAKSFGLRDAPQNLSTTIMTYQQKKNFKPRVKRSGLGGHLFTRSQVASMLRSEYSHGFRANFFKVKKQRKPLRSRRPQSENI